jgi:hypothetical protein
MKLWIDDVRPAPDGYIWIRSVNSAKHWIEQIEYEAFTFDREEIELISIDHDAGDYACCGGDYIKLLDWLEETGRNYPIRIHSMNPVGVANMRQIIQRNGWKEVF